MVDATTLDATTFNLAAALQGINYPTAEAIVPLDMGHALNLNTKIEERQRLNRRKTDGDDVERDLARVNEEIEELKDKVRNNCLRVTIRGISSEAQDLFNKKRFELGARKRPVGKSASEWDYENGRELSLLLWKAYIVRIEMGGRAIDPVEEADVETLFHGLPAENRGIIDKALEEMASNTMAGYEAAIRDHDFSSAP